MICHTNGVADVFLRQVYNGLWTTVRFTVAADGADANGASRSIRLNQHPFGPDLAA